jgi:hypothetical protein
MRGAPDLPEMKLQSLAIAITVACGLSACTPGMNAAVETAQRAFQRDAGTDSVRLDPKFSFLRVTASGRVAFLALGGIDAHPDGPIEVWYSALREVVRVQNGRVVGITGFKTEWRNVSIAAAPSWTAAAKAEQPLQWVRVRDVMPGYRYGIRDELAVIRVAAPARSELRAVDAGSLLWFEERMNNRAGYVASLFSTTDTNGALPPARYAVDLSDGKETVVYGEQCLAADFCFTWQRWSAEQQNKAAGGR